jgi:hypothetical protein
VGRVLGSDPIGAEGGAVAEHGLIDGYLQTLQQSVR